MSDTDRYRDAARRVDREIRHEMAFECRLDMLEYAIRTEAEAAREAAVKARDEEWVSAWERTPLPEAQDPRQLSGNPAEWIAGSLADAEQRGREAERREVEAEARKRMAAFPPMTGVWLELRDIADYVASRNGPQAETQEANRPAGCDEVTQPKGGDLTGPIQPPTSGSYQGPAVTPPGSPSPREAGPGAYYRHTSEGRVPISREEYRAAEADIFGRLDPFPSPQRAAGEQLKYRVVEWGREHHVYVGDKVIASCWRKSDGDRIAAALNAQETPR